LSIFRILALMAMVAAGSAAVPARADELSSQQEAIRAPLRDKYIQAKQFEKDAIERRQAVLDRMSALLQGGNQELDQIRKARVETSNALVDKRTARRQAAQALSLALGRAAGNANDPTVKDAQAKLDALDAEVAALEKKLAGYDLTERDKISIPSTDAVFAELLKANLELDEKRQNVIEALAAYLAVLRPEPPPYLQSVQVYVGGKAMYRAEWRVDGQSADIVTRELTERLERVLADAKGMLTTMQEMRDDLRDERIKLLGPVIRYSGEINLAAIDIRFAGIMVVLAPAMIEAAGVVIEVALSGGASTVERHAVEEGVKAGTALAAALGKKNAGKALTLAEEAVIAHIDQIGDEVTDQLLNLVQAKLAKERSDKLMNWRANNLIDQLGLKAGSSDAAKILVSDTAEQVIGRTAKAGVAVLGYKVVTALATASGEHYTKWQAVKSGTAAFFTAKTPIARIKEGFTGSRGANVLGLCITAAKTVAAAYYGAKLGEAEEKYAEAIAEFDFAYHGYYVLLQADRILFDKMREVQELYFQAFAYRLQTAGPRTLAVLANEGNNDPSETLTFALHFSQPLDKAPKVRIAGLVIEMKPQGADDKGRAAHWEGQLPANKFPDTLEEGVLDVSLADGSKPYAALDANPGTAARFVIPDDLGRPLGDREEWSDYERGNDRNHRIAFHPPKAQAPVPWRGQSTCAKINCDCGAVGTEWAQRICSVTENSLREVCAKNGQTFGACPAGASGPAAYPLPVSTAPLGSPATQPIPIEPPKPVRPSTPPLVPMPLTPVPPPAPPLTPPPGR